MSILKKINLAGWILIALVLGILAGLALLGNPDFATTYIKPIGTIFVNLLKFIVAPIVLLSIICGIISMGDIKKVGSLGWKTVVYYLVTTLIAIVIGLVFGMAAKGVFPVLDTSGATYEAKSTNLMDTLVNIFPSNLVQSFADSNMLQIIVIALLIGAAILVVGKAAKPFAQVLESANEVFNKIMMFIITVSPIGVFCLMCSVVAVNGPSIVGSLAVAIGVAYLAYLTHMFIVYSASLKFLGKKSPIQFFKAMIPAMVFAFSSSSSVATLPLTTDCANKAGANPEYSSFILPLGATINMDGTAIYMGVASIFIATCYGVDLTIMQMATIVVTATLASIGTAGVSGAGVLMLTMVLQSVGLPVEGIALILGADKLFDMGRTTLNIVGDATAAVVLTRIQDGKAYTADESLDEMTKEGIEALGEETPALEATEAPAIEAPVAEDAEAPVSVAAEAPATETAEASASKE